MSRVLPTSHWWETAHEVIITALITASIVSVEAALLGKQGVVLHHHVLVQHAMGACGFDEGRDCSAGVVKPLASKEELQVVV